MAMPSDFPPVAGRCICLDTETTGLSARTDRICEIAAVEFDPHTWSTVARYHAYVNPERSVPYGAFRVHGLSTAFLSDKPVFASVAGDFLDFIADANLFIHNAAYDTRMLDAELGRLGLGPISYACRSVTCTLRAAERLRGRGGNRLDDLCRLYGIDLSDRTLHGALIDSELLVQVVRELGRRGAVFGA